MTYFVYLRGEPGVGKITVARLLEQDLAAKVFWFHDIKNAVFRVVGEHRIPRLMDRVVAPILEHVLAQGGTIIYVRPSRDAATVAQVRRIVEGYPAYQFVDIRLTASRATLIQRVSQRDDPYRISNADDLTKYLDERPDTPAPGEILIRTDDLTPQDVADEIRRQLAARER